MTRAGFAVAAIALGATVGVAVQDVIKECCTRARAQTQAAPGETTIWDHNGSVTYLVTNGSSREFYYQKPRPGMLEAGARPGSLLFRGEIKNGQYVGTAFIFNAHCGQIPFQVKGPIISDEERIVLTGQARRVGRNCHTYGSYTSNLEFRRLKQNEVAQSQAPLTPAQALSESKPEVPPNKPIAQPSVTNENPLAAKDSSSSVAEPKGPSTQTAQSPVTNETPSKAKDLDHYLWGVAFIVMTVSLFGFLIGKVVFRRKGIR